MVYDKLLIKVKAIDTSRCVLKTDIMSRKET